MVIAKENPIGLDALIARMQKVLHDKLSALWNFDIDVYPRCYVNARMIDEREENTIEHYSSKDNYDNLIYAEGIKCFFIQSGDTTPRNMVTYNTEITLFFTVNLSEVKPLIQHRADEEVRNDVLSVLKHIPEATVLRVVTGIDNVYSGFPYKSNDDFHPNHCFKIEMGVYYDPKKKNCIN